jgi:hypothetical protein
MNRDYNAEWRKQNWFSFSSDAAVKSWINYLPFPIPTGMQMNSVAMTHMEGDVICNVACQGWMKVVSTLSVREINFSTYASQTYYAGSLISICSAHKWDHPWRVIWNECYKCKISVSLRRTFLSTTCIIAIAKLSAYICTPYTSPFNQSIKINCTLRRNVDQKIENPV